MEGLGERRKGRWLDGGEMGGGGRLVEEERESGGVGV